MGWLIALAIVIGIGWIPLGVQVRYDEEGFLVRVIAFFLRLPKRHPVSQSKPSPQPKRRAESCRIFSRL